MEQPVRIQLSRRKGFRLPPNTVSVARPSKWGNPYVVGTTKNLCGRPMDAEDAVNWFRANLECGMSDISTADVRRELRGKNLACWCPVDGPCHGDLLLQIANN